jgi:hypothetical protein
VVGTFPDGESALNLVAARLGHISTHLVLTVLSQHAAASQADAEHPNRMPDQPPPIRMRKILDTTA